MRMKMFERSYRGGYCKLIDWIMLNNIINM